MVRIGTLEIGEFPLLLAPMEDVSDPPFRHVCKMFGADVMYTEFISSEGLIRDAVKSVKKLDFTEFERPIGIQIFGHDIASMIRAARYAEEAAPDLIDINIGCPVRKVVSKGAGAGLLNDLPRMSSMAEAVVKATRLPVTVKTRLGWDSQHKNIVEIAERLQDVGIKAITIHGRTRTQGMGEPADWTLIGEVKHNPRMTIPVFGNGDIFTPQSASQFRDTYGVDGLMIARGSYGNPWIFREIRHYLETGHLLSPPDIHERIRVCRIHLEKSVAWKGERTAILEMRKHYSHYFRGYPEFKPFRVKLMKAETEDELDIVLSEIERAYQGEK
jgi:tRNA-dihydrouridine synthase B